MFHEDCSLENIAGGRKGHNKKKNVSGTYTSRQDIALLTDVCGSSFRYQGTVWNRHLLETKLACAAPASRDLHKCTAAVLIPT